MAGATSLVDQRQREVVIVFVIASPRLLTLRKYHAESSIECLRFDGTCPDHSSNNFCRLSWHVQSTVVPAHGTQGPETPPASRYDGFTSLRPLPSHERTGELNRAASVRCVRLTRWSCRGTSSWTSAGPYQDMALPDMVGKCFMVATARPYQREPAECVRIFSQARLSPETRGSNGRPRRTPGLRANSSPVAWGQS